MHIYIPFLIIQILLVLLTCFGCLVVAAYMMRYIRHPWIIYSCKCFTQHYLKPVLTYKWSGKEHPAVCKKCGTTYSYKYFSLMWRLPFEKWSHFRYYRIPGFQRVGYEE
jgi:hypothetical protein